MMRQPSSPSGSTRGSRKSFFLKLLVIFVSFSIFALFAINIEFNKLFSTPDKPEFGNFVELGNIDATSLKRLCDENANTNDIETESNSPIDYTLFDKISKQAFLEELLKKMPRNDLIILLNHGINTSIKKKLLSESSINKVLSIYKSYDYRLPSDAKPFSQIFDSPDKVIYDNPLLYNECKNAIINVENLDISKLKQEMFDYYKDPKNKEYLQSLPWKFRRAPANVPNVPIWTREAVDALKKPLHKFRINGMVRANFDPIAEWNHIRDPENFPEVIYKDKNLTRTAFYHIPKCGSSSIGIMLKQIGRTYGFDFTRTPGHWRTRPNHNVYVPLRDLKCGFSFVRDPLHRVVSAYYTINMFLWDDHHNYFKKLKEDPTQNLGIYMNFLKNYKRYKFINITGEPQRFRMFVKELLDNTNEFVRFPPLQHAVSQTEHLAVFYKSPIHFIGRVEHFEKHFELLTQFPYCKDHLTLKHIDDKPRHAMRGEGIIPPAGAPWKLHPKYKIMLNLTQYNYTTSDKYSLPAWLSMTQEMLNGIVEMYYQDYICFGYKPEYKRFGMSYTGKYKF